MTSKTTVFLHDMITTSVLIVVVVGSILTGAMFGFTKGYTDATLEVQTQAMLHEFAECPTNGEWKSRHTVAYEYLATTEAPLYAEDEQWNKPEQPN